MIHLIETPDRKAAIENASMARVISIGTSWNKLRIGFRASWTENLINPGACPLYLGVMADPAPGLTNGPLTAITSHFVGVLNSQVITRNAGPPVHYNPPALSAATRVGSTEAVGSGATGRWIVGDARLPYIVQINKGSPSFSISSILPHPTTAIEDVAIDIPLTIMIQAMETGTLVTSMRDVVNAYTGKQTMVNSSTVTRTVDETANGFLNAIVLAWGRTSFYPKVSELLWCELP